jgi:riboflavin kinase/FMN adenylyltransferase
MQMYTSPHSLPAAARNAVLAIGNFDGVHRGHAALIDMVKREAVRLGAPSGVLTFEPHPRALFRPDDPPFRLTPFDLKRERLEALGLDFTVALPFDWNFASQSAGAFVQNVLKDGLAPSHIVVGTDFRFGQLRKGSADTLREAGFPVSIAEAVADEEGTVFASSRIREYLRHGDIKTANALLGWDWEMRGIVQKGDQRGRELGYPTANVPLGETLHPGYGVYATLVHIEGEDQWLPAATNIGIRPMFELKIGQIEAHILYFDRDIYGRMLRVRPVKKLRGEAKFDNLDALIEQIESDCEQTRQLLI